MSNKQLFTMWCGIGAIVLPWCLVICYDIDYIFLVHPFIWPFIVSLVTIGFIVTLRYKEHEDLHLKRGFFRLILVLSIVAFTYPLIRPIFCALIAIISQPFSTKYLRYLPQALMKSGIGFATFWVVYGVVNYIVVPAVNHVLRGFCDVNTKVKNRTPVHEQKE